MPSDLRMAVNYAHSSNGLMREQALRRELPEQNTLAIIPTFLEHISDTIRLACTYNQGIA
jgi:hypothetical protein